MQLDLAPSYHTDGKKKKKKGQSANMWSWSLENADKRFC